MLPSSLGTNEHSGWQCTVGCQVQDGGWTKRLCWAGPFPYCGHNGWCNCSPGGTVACAADGLVYLPGSSWRWIPGACGLTQWWKTYCRCTFGISLLQRWQLASLSLCWHTSVQFWQGPCWQKLWVCHFAGVLHRGLPVRHQLVLSQGVKGQNTRGWHHWQQLKSGIMGAVPDEVCVLLEQLSQRGGQGGQTRDEGTEVCD